ncbi:hypothetical protein, partial [uncultured Victivallis sp.]|uniref:hypothetical protein n=1 Tax=uncultured Victivallis sp. TaxID=354118 RepID=UPI0025D80C1C
MERGRFSTARFTVFSASSGSSSTTQSAPATIPAWQTGFQLLLPVIHHYYEKVKRLTLSLVIFFLLFVKLRLK